jgi:hypothetical protein
LRSARQILQVHRLGSPPRPRHPRAVQQLPSRLREEKPCMSLFENVLGLEATNHGRDFDYVLSTILATGFVVQSLRSDPSTLGKCYRRPRIFLVLMRQDLAIVSSWLLMDYQPTRDQCLQKRKTFSVARDHLGLTPPPPVDLRADGAVFLTPQEAISPPRFAINSGILSDLLGIFRVPYDHWWWCGLLQPILHELLQHRGFGR